MSALRRVTLLVVWMATTTACASAEVSTPDVTPSDGGGADTSLASDTDALADAPSVDGADTADVAASEVAKDATSDGVADSVTTPTDTATLSDTRSDTASDAPGEPRTMLLQDSFAAFPKPSLAGPALDVLGRPYITVDKLNFNATWDALLPTWELLIIDTPSESWGFNMIDQRVIAFVNAGGRVVFAHWELWMHPGLETAPEVDATPTSTFRTVVRDPAAMPDLFAMPQAVPSPLANATPEASTYPAQRLVLKNSGSLVALYGDTADYVLAVTKGGRVIVNGFKPFLYRHQDVDGDNKPDMQELWENEIRYVLSK